jgi:hypothetical protein
MRRSARRPLAAAARTKIKGKVKRKKVKARGIQRLFKGYLKAVSASLLPFSFDLLPASAFSLYFS